MNIAQENFNLTKREVDILTEIVNGKSNNEISKHLSVSINTVKAHCKSIFSKLNVRNRVEATVKALHDGIIWI